jgi:CRP-like cAMP-binding protein
MAKADHSLQQRCEMIDRTQWADEFSWNQIKRLATYLESYKIPAGDVILREGGRDAYMILIVAGRVHIVKQDSNGAPKRIATLDPGKTLGEMSLIDGEPRSASVVAATDVSLLVMTEDNFNRLTRELPSLAVGLVLKIAKMMSQRLRQTSGRLIDYLES